MQRISSSLPPLASLRAFEAVSRLGSVKLASEYLNVTPSAISHQLRTLETHFGVQLIQMKGRHICLTDEGAIYAPAIIHAFADLFRANDLLSRFRSRPAINVCAPPTFAMLAALPHLDQFNSTNARFDLRLEARNSKPHFDEDLYDAAVCVGKPPFEGWFAHRLFKSRIVPLAHRKVWEKFGPIDTASDLARMPLIDFRGAPIVWHRWIREIDPSCDCKKEEPYLISDSLLTAIQMAESEMGVVLAPFPLIVPKVSAGLLCGPSRRFPYVKGESDFYFVGRIAVEHSAKVIAVQKWLVAISRKLELEAQSLGY